jgi:hypothetical protein
MRPPGWLVGISIATATLHLAANSRLMALGMVAFLLVPAIAMWAGAAAASIVDARHAKRNTAAVICAVIALFLGHLAMIQLRPLPPGSAFGGATVDPRAAGSNSGASEVFRP